MTLSGLQQDTLAELFNIGMGRAAHSLSTIVGEEVLLSVPHISLLDPAHVDIDTFDLGNGHLGAVTQHFGGPFEAEAILLFPEEQALSIVRDMVGSSISLDELTEFEQEAMCEVGNIILNACISAMADILNIEFDSSLPVYSIDSPETIVDRALAVNSTSPMMLVLHINMALEKRQVQGKLVFLLASSSIEKLLTQLDFYLSTI